jgi:hypothetical protein
MKREDKKLGTSPVCDGVRTLLQARKSRFNMISDAIVSLFYDIDLSATNNDSGRLIHYGI